MDWFTLSLAAMILYGVQNFVYKVVAQKNLNTGLVLMSSFFTGAVFSGILLYFNPVPMGNIFILVFAAVQASFYLISRYVKIESFKCLPAVVVLPISRVHFALTALLGIAILREPFSWNIAAGIFLFLAVILVLSSNNSKDEVPHSNFRAGFALALATAIFTTVSEILVKVAAVRYDTVLFMFLSYLWLVAPSYLFGVGLGSRKSRRRECIIYGFLVGLFNFTSFLAAMSALKEGPASVVFPVIGLNMLITVFLAVTFYREKITPRRLMALVLSVAAIMLFRQ